MTDPDHGVILDVTPGDGEAFETDLLARLGHPVMVCHGPEPAIPCPLLEEGGCDLLDDAHGIVFQLDLDRPQHRAILARYQKVIADGVPLWAVVKPGQDQTYRDLLIGVEVLTHQPTAGELDGMAARVEAADRTAE